MKRLKLRGNKTLLGWAVVTLLVAVSSYQIAFVAQSESQPAEAIPYLTLNELATALAHERDLVLVEFGVPSGCTRCDQMRTSIDRLAVERGELLKVRRVDLKQHLSLVWELGLTDCPSYIAFRDGEEVFRATYPTSADLIASGLDRVLDNSKADQLAQSSL